VHGAFEFTVDGETAVVGAGEALAVPSGAARQFRAGGAGTPEAEAIVCMAAGGQATLPGSDARQSLPWAL
jgi:quercetin dioxygenase-like cupin family protein